MKTKRFPQGVTYVAERGFQQSVIDLAHVYGWTVGFTWSSLHSPFGEPDLRLWRVETGIIGVPARLLWVELKTERGQPTAEQYEWLEQGRFIPGVECYLFRPSDFESGEIQEVLR